jgi:hypothetical protein
MKPTRFEVAVLLITAVIISYQIFIPPLIGLADSGDFGRIIPWRGLSHVPTEYDQRYFNYFNSQYRIIPKWAGPDWYKTSTSLIIAPSRWISIRIGRDQYFDIRILAAIHILIFMLGLWLILAGSRSLTTSLRVTLCSLLVLIFTDAGYIAYFNSFYSEATALSFLAVAVGSSLVLLTNRSSSVALLIGYFVAIGMLITSKPQYIPIAPGLALFGVYLSRVVKFTWKYPLSGFLAAAVTCMAFWYFTQTPRILGVQNAYIEIFMDLLPHSSTPRQDLSEIGLNPNFAEFTGTTPYQRDSPLNNPQFQAEFSEKINSLTVPMFYLSHPDRLYSLCARCAKHAFSTRVSRLGYYEAYTGKPLTLPFAIWSSVRENMFPRSMFFLVFFCATGLGAIALQIKTSSTVYKNLCILYQLFILIAVAQFFVAVLVGGGEADLEKHLFMFNLAFDVCFILCVLWTVYTLQTFRSSFLNKKVERAPVESLAIQ